MLALLLVCALGQANSDPVVSQRTWLFASLKADLEAKGQTDPAQLQQTREQIDRLTPGELQTLVNMYQRLKQGDTPANIYTDAIADRDQSVVTRDQLRLELDLRTHLPVAALVGGAGYAGNALIGSALYGGLPAASMVPGSYGGPALPYAGPMGFGTFTATGPIRGYSAPFLPAGGGPMGGLPMGGGLMGGGPMGGGPWSPMSPFIY